MIRDKAKPVKTIPGRGGIVTFRRNTRASVRGLWSGALSENQALRVFRAAIAQSLERAWLEGAQECGIQEDELTQDEIIARENFILSQSEFAEGFISDVAKQSKSTGGKLMPLLQRNEMWVNQYSSAKQQSEALACADDKRVWRLGKAEHCISCVKLDGQVRRLSFWKNNVMPRNAPNPSLKCKGFNCKCTLQKTDRALSRGRLPRLP